MTDVTPLAVTTDTPQVTVRYRVQHYITKSGEWNYTLGGNRETLHAAQTVVKKDAQSWARVRDTSPRYRILVETTTYEVIEV